MHALVDFFVLFFVFPYAYSLVNTLEPGYNTPVYSVRHCFQITIHKHAYACLYQISPIYYITHFLSLVIIVSSYHEKIYLTHAGPFIYLGFFMLCHYFSLRIKVSSYHKKYILLRAFHILRIFILCHYLSLRIIVSSYHEKYILLRAFHIPRIFILCHYLSLRIKVSSYHEKIYLTQVLSYTLDFYIMSLFFTSYHSIIVSRKNISYSGIPRIFILCHLSLRIIVSSYHEKIYLTQVLLYTLDFYIMSLFFTSYHSIIVSRKNISYSGPLYTSDFYIMSLFITSYHSIIVSRKNISYSCRAFHIPRIFIYPYNEYIMTSYHDTKLQFQKWTGIL